MPKVSRWTLEEEREKELLNQLWTAITLLEDKKEVIDFLKALLTPSESIMLAKRIELVKLHDFGLPLNDIRKLLHITKVTSYKWQERLDLYYREFKVIIDRLRDLEAKRLEKEAWYREMPQARKRHSMLISALGTAAVLGHKKLKKVLKRKSASQKP